MADKITITIDPACDLLYASYYLYGLQRIPQARILFSDAPFQGLIPDQQYLALEILVNKNRLKIIIDHSNLDDIHRDAYDWCDRYGKVNLNTRDVTMDKVIPIGPLFSIRLFGGIHTYLLLISNLIKSYQRIKSVKRFISAYRLQLKRSPYSAYRPARRENGYVFFAGGLWRREDKYNQLRNTFINVCKQIKILHFEGGFAPRKTKAVDGFTENTMAKRFNHADYLEKVKSSHFVFNNPSVRDCNGWRTAEFLSLGKIILSIPLVRVMPGSFQGGVHFVETDGSAVDLREKVLDITENPGKYEALELAAREYFENHLEPKVVIQRMIPEFFGI